MQDPRIYRYRMMGVSPEDRLELVGAVGEAMAGEAAAVRIHVPAELASALEGKGGDIELRGFAAEFRLHCRRLGEKGKAVVVTTDGNPRRRVDVKPPAHADEQANPADPSPMPVSMQDTIARVISLDLDRKDGSAMQKSLGL
jgi:hypothetical protein